MTEGEKKALSATQEGFPTIGLVGVEGWHPAKSLSLIPGLFHIEWKNRTEKDGGKVGLDDFLAGEGLPFAEILSARRIERVFAKHGCSFGRHGIYTSAIMVWSFLSQVLRDGKEASCQVNRRLHVHNARRVSEGCTYYRARPSPALRP